MAIVNSRRSRPRYLSARKPTAVNILRGGSYCVRGYWAEVWVRWAVYSISAGIHNDNATRWTYIRREFFRTLNAALFREGWMVARMAFVYRWFPQN